MVKHTRYINYSLKLTESQLEKIIKAVQNHEGTVIRLQTVAGGDVLKSHKIPLTQSQINKIKASRSELNLKLTAAQLKYLKKSGGFLPLLALLPLLFGGLGAAGGITGAIASAVSSAGSARAATAAQAEQERHNREVEAQLKNGGGSCPSVGRGRGFISDKIENIPILGRLSPYLRKLGLGICDCKKLINGERVVTKGGLEVNIGHGIFLGPSGGSGSGIFMGSSEGNGIFLGPKR
jgi:hypothetical protein